MDQELRVVIKSTLHLPNSTTNGLLYVSKKDGGLRIPRLERLLSSTALKAGLKFWNNPGPTMRGLAAGSRGLATHEGHEHPEVRNQARLKSAEPRAPKPRKVLEGGWTLEEIRLLEELEVRYSDERFINKALEPHFPGKTNKQISSKRSDLRRRQVRRAESDSGSEENDSNSTNNPDETFNTKFDNGILKIFRPVPEVLDGEEDEVTWRRTLATSVVSSYHKLKNKLKGKEYPDLALRLVSIAESIVRDPARIPETCSESLEQAAEKLTDLMTREKPAERQGIPGKNQKEGKRAFSNRRTSRRKRNFERVRHLAEKDMKRLADPIVKDELYDLEQPRTSLPKTEDIESLYSTLWSNREQTTFTGSWGRKLDALRGVTVIPPIEIAKIRARYRRLKAKTAAGPDGVEKSDISEKALTIMTLQFNGCLAAGYYPKSWKINQTALIPKCGKDPLLIANWQPITISSVISGLFSGTTDESLRNHVEFSYRQKGFTSEAGTANNVVILQKVLAVMKKEEGGVCSLLDISKAFDTVPHEAIVPAGTRLGVPSYIASYIARNYEGCKTVIKGCDGNVDLELLRDKDVSVLAFADDLTLVNKSVKGTEDDILTTVDYFKSLGMNLSISKCCSFKIRALRKTWTIENPELKIRGVNVEYAGPDKGNRYLGIDFTPWKGSISGGDSLRRLVDCISRTAGVKTLKLMQKLELIKKYLQSMAADDEIRQIIRRIFHLADSLTDYFVYTRTRDGGLGLPRLETTIQLAVLRRHISMTESKDEVVRRIAESPDQSEITKSYPESRILCEPTLQTVAGERRKPDLVIKKRERVFIVDVAVCYEDGASLKAITEVKRTKYEEVKEAALGEMGGRSVEIIPFAVGARGIVPIFTVNALRKLGIYDRSLMMTIQMVALRASISLACESVETDHLQEAEEQLLWAARKRWPDKEIAIHPVILGAGRVCLVRTT
ncbi:uncharacterized protein [Leptinotarsa decemlineata]|uniref:uncharacterized protein n=1 Tax=Leptinotarsa decemlineata TaxID=7539 RepID=UPI003D30AD49